MADASELWVGLRCDWRHTCRGGYGFTVRVPVTVRRVGTKKSLVLVEKEGKEVWVTNARLCNPNHTQLDKHEETSDATGM